MARPSKADNIRKDEFEALLKIQCTCQEVCSVFHVTRQTLRKWVRETYGCSYEAISQEYAPFGWISIRRALMRLMEKNPAVAIFMAKNYLGLTDDPHPVDTGEERKEFNAAVKAAVNALEGSDLARLAEFAGDGEEGGDG